MKRQVLQAMILFAALFLLGACSAKKNQDDMTWLHRGVERASSQLKANALLFEQDSLLPRTFKNGEIVTIGPRDWTSGFFPGSLWLMYDLTGDPFFNQQAVLYTSKLHELQNLTDTHDLGFMVYCSYGKQFAALQDKQSPEIILKTAENLAGRFDDTIGLIRSWDFGTWNYPVIIDNMMNLEMLFWASRFSGDMKFRDAAVSHADKTIANHYRDDFSCFHVVSYNDDGSVESQGTFQGFADASSWARGQAWGLYGYTMCYRETNQERYLTQARGIAGFIMENPVTPVDLIPYWDYNAPGIPNAKRDASAAAVMASAFLELSTLTQGEEAQKYFSYGERMLKSLSSDEYLAQEGTNGNFILKHCVGFFPANSEVDVPLNYADYYYLEALARYLTITGRSLKAGA